MNSYPTNTLFLLLILSGCGLNATQREATSRFASASAELGEFSASELLAFRHATIEMNIKDIAIGGTAKLTQLDESFNMPNVTARVNAAQALSSYGNLLLALADETQQTDLKKPLSQFVDNLKGVPDKILSDPQLDGLGVVAYDIGGLFIEQQKAKAVKKIVSDSKTDIDHICDLFIRDLSETQLNMLQGVDTTATRLMADADIAIASTHDIQDRILATEAFALADEQKNRAKIMGEKGIAALQALKLANAELVNALNNNSQSLADTRALGLKMRNLGLALKVFNGH